jgi:hypothetical protein
MQVDVKQTKIKYRTTWIAIIIVMSFTIVSSVVLRFLLSRENARRDKAALISPAPSLPNNLQEYAPEKELELRTEESSLEDVMNVDKDLTDWEDKSFRYAL